MSARLPNWFHSLRGVTSGRPVAEFTDGDLVRLFAHTRDEAAFAELLHRHGPMVLATCRRILERDTHSADDAFQAAFLVLATKADAVRPPERVGAWLYGVAVHVAKKAREWVRKLTPSAPSVLDTVPANTVAPDPDLPHIRHAIDDVLAGLPAKYRAPIVLCELEGLSRTQAAAALGWTEGTLSGRLARAKKLLADRLSRRGVSLPAAGLTVALLAQPATAIVPAQLVASTLHAALLVAAGAGSADVTTEPVANLARGVVPTMTPTFKVLAASVAGIGLTLGLGLFNLFAQEPPVASTPTPNPLVLATAGQGEKIAPQEWKLAHTWKFPHKLRSVAVGTDFVVAGDKEGTLAIFDLKTGKEREKLREGTDGGEAPGIERVQLSPDNKFIYMTLESNGFHQTTVEQKGRDTHGIAGGKGMWQPFGVTRDGRVWLVESRKTDELIVVKNTLGTKPLGPETLLKHERSVEFAAGDSEDVIATVTGGRGDPILRFWSKGKDKPVWEVDLWTKIGTIDVVGVAVSPGGKLVAITGDAGDVWIFDAKTGKRIAEAVADETADLGPISDVTFSPDGKRIAVATGQFARVLDTATGKELAEWKAHDKGEQVMCIAFGPDGTTLATGSTDKTVKVWELRK